MKYYKFKCFVDGRTKSNVNEEQCIYHRLPKGSVVLVLESKLSLPRSYDGEDHYNDLYAIAPEYGFLYIGRIHENDYMEL